METARQATPAMFAEDWIRPDGNGGVIIGDASPIPAEDLPQIMVWICKAATGRQPIVLPRPVVSRHGESGPRWSISINEFGQVRLAADCELSADDASTVAAVLAATADDARFTPEPAGVERLAAFLNEQMDTDTKTLARRLLADFDVKERTTAEMGRP